MLNPDQRKIVTKVYEHLLDHERSRWDDIDDYIKLLEYLDDDQLYRETSVIYDKFKNGNVGCSEKHTKDKCFVPLLVQSISYLLDLHKDGGDLGAKHQYIFHYFLALDQKGLILAAD